MQMPSTAVAYNGQGEPIHQAVHAALVEEQAGQESAWLQANKSVPRQMVWDEEAVAAAALEAMRANEAQAAYAEAKAYMALSSMGQATGSWADTPNCQDRSDPMNHFMDSNQPPPFMQADMIDMSEANGHAAAAASGGRSEDMEQASVRAFQECNG